MVTGASYTRCRSKRVIQGAKETTLANGRPALQGTCPACGTKLLRFVAAGAAGWRAAGSARRPRARRG